MTALLILGAMIAPLLYAVTNHLDKILLGEYEDSSLTLWAISLLVSIVPAIVIYLLAPDVLTMSAGNIVVMFINGLLNTILLRLYLLAMDQDEPTATITFYQLVPIFGVLLGYVVLGEFFTIRTFFGMFLIMMGTSLLIFLSGKVTLRIRTILLMGGASLCWAGESTIFKMVAIETDLWQALFWENFSMFVCGLISLLFPTVRTSISVVFKRPGMILTLSMANESLYILGNLAASVMLTLVPVAINLLFNTFQTFFVLGLGLILSRYISGYEASLTKKTVIRYIISIVITTIGVYLIGEWE